MPYEIYEKQGDEWKKVGGTNYSKVVPKTSAVSGAAELKALTVDGINYNIPQGASGSYLPLAGGTLTGNLTISKANPMVAFAGSGGQIGHKKASSQTYYDNEMTFGDDNLVIKHNFGVSEGQSLTFENNGVVLLKAATVGGGSTSTLSLGENNKLQIEKVSGSGFWEVLDKSMVVDNLTSSDAYAPLSANQGKVLNNSKIPKTDIVDNLTTDVSTKVLSAKQGKVLKDIVDLLPKTLFDIIYPVGITYVQHTADDAPSSIFAYGTWEDITSSVVSSGCRYPAFSPNEIGTKLDQELPNIRGEMNATPCAASGMIGNGAFGESGKWSDYGCGYGNNYANGHYIFNANQSNGIYKDGANVQPYTYTVKLWKRTA